jgi:thiol:disulfide interchange protein/DsbC/DsbD-like thiol-disulfide interchange protein
MSRLLLPLLLVGSLCAADAFPGVPGMSPSTNARLVSEMRTIAPGSSFTVALELKHPPGWHSYYQNSGGPELPVTVSWNLPEGFSAGALQSPVPRVKDGFFGKSFIHDGSPVFLTRIEVPQRAPSGTIRITADARWQICAESCVDEKRSLSLELPVTAAAEPDPAATALIDAARAALPADSAGWKISAESAADGIHLRIEPAADWKGTPADFVPDQAFVKSAGDGGSLTKEGNAWLLKLKRAEKDALDAPIRQGTALSGILMGDHPVAIPITEIRAPADAGAPSTAAKPRTGLAAVLGGMFLGGLLLNLMPCVFPVIGLKIMGFVNQAGSDRRQVLLHGLIFAAGVFVSFAVLSGVLYQLRSAVGGAGTGWGFQLQNPWMVLALMFLMLAMAMNLAGVFEFGTSATGIGGSLQTKQGLTGSFFTGALATVIATPCSGPFLGFAIGAAVGLPAVGFFSSFAAMAAGLALPYLMLSAFPGWVSRLPRPGPWMESFKQSMSFPLFATAGFLLWVYGGIITYDKLLGPVLGLNCLAVALWIHGRWNLPHRNRKTRTLAIALAAAFAVGGIWLAKPPAKTAIEWKPWSAETERSLLAAGKPVYIDFTAKWCATCQLNKSRAYTPEVVALMQRKGVVALQADKTKETPEIEAALRKLGRTAIPVNVLIAPGKEPVILPELLRPADLLKALESL